MLEVPVRGMGRHARSGLAATGFQQPAHIDPAQRWRSVRPKAFSVSFKKSASRSRSARVEVLMVPACHTQRAIGKST